MNSVISEYKNTIQNPSVEPNDNLGIVVSVIIFGAVAIFVGLYIYNFIKGYKSANNSSNNIEEMDNTDSAQEDFSSMKAINNQIIICNNCGEENDSGSNFCKNCGNRLK